MVERVMTQEKRNILPKWFINLLIGIAITVISAILIAGIFALLDIFKNKSKIKYIEKRMEKFEIKQDRVLLSQNTTNSTLKLLVYQVRQNNNIMKELKAEVKGSYAEQIERKRAKFKTLSENQKIALHSTF